LVHREVQANLVQQEQVVLVVSQGLKDQLDQLGLPEEQEEPVHQVDQDLKDL
jgi:hypothetical protein